MLGQDIVLAVLAHSVFYTRSLSALQRSLKRRFLTKKCRVENCSRTRKAVSYYISSPRIHVGGFFPIACISRYEKDWEGKECDKPVLLVVIFVVALLLLFFLIKIIIIILIFFLLF